MTTAEKNLRGENELEGAQGLRFLRRWLVVRDW